MTNRSWWCGNRPAELKALQARIVDEVNPGQAAGGNESEHRL